MQLLKNISRIPNLLTKNKVKASTLIGVIVVFVFYINQRKNNKSRQSSNYQSQIEPNIINAQPQSEIIHQSPPQVEQVQGESVCPNIKNVEQMQLQNVQYTFENSILIQSRETQDSQQQSKVFAVSELLEKIYNQTCRARDVKEEFRFFVSDLKDEEYLVEEYGCKNDKLPQTLRDNLNGMRRSRGDGNCFYTSFGYQFLQYYILHNSDHEFQYLIDLINSLEFQVTLKDISATQQEGQQMKELLLQYCKQIREYRINDRKEQFHTLFADPNGQFYGLSIIFLRSLAYNICNQDEETKVLFEALELDLKKQLIEWEFDCENNQVVIAKLAAYLKIKIIIYYVESETFYLDIQKYSPNQNDEQKFLISILFRPGHYNIAIPK